MARWRIFADGAISVLAGIGTLAATTLGAGGVLMLLYYRSAIFDHRMMNYFPYVAVLSLLLAMFYAIAAGVLVFKRLHRRHQLPRKAG